MKRESRALHFYNDRVKQTEWPSDNMCDPPTPANIALHTLQEELLGEGWYITMPESQEQVNTAIVSHILHQYIDQANEFPWLRLIVDIGCFLLGAVIGMIV
ncbi:MAG: hypothetical protein NC114_06555 [Ruminococcus flavefaciens]|nr:hypothetical protein [Ruminococcus flavefaciens]